jgi:hypothetical protein
MKIDVYENDRDKALRKIRLSSNFKICNFATVVSFVFKLSCQCTLVFTVKRVLVQVLYRLVTHTFKI